MARLIAAVSSVLPSPTAPWLRTSKTAGCWRSAGGRASVRANAKRTRTRAGTVQVLRFPAVGRELPARDGGDESAQADQADEVREYLEGVHQIAPRPHGVDLGDRAE